MTGLAGAFTDHTLDACESVGVGRDAQPGEEGFMVIKISA